MKCQACSKDITSEIYYYCSYHQKALENLKENYKIWKNSYDDKLTWNEYLNKIIKLKSTGKIIKEVIKIELEIENEK